MDTINKSLTEIDDCLYRVSVKVIIIQNNKLLVTQEDDGWLSLPGGGIEYNEMIEEAVERELKEEIGLEKADYKIDKLLFASNGTVLDGIPKLNLYFKIKLIKKHRLYTGNQLEARWINKTELEKTEVGPTFTIVKSQILALLD